METGYIKLHRKILDWEWYDDSNTFRLFIYFLLKANHTNKLWRGIEIKKGSFITSIDTMSKDLGISVMSVRTAINKLLLTNEITKSSTSKYTIITVNNYNEYQGVTNEATNEQQTSNKQVTTTKNDKNEKNEKKEDNIVPFKNSKKQEFFLDAELKIKISEKEYIEKVIESFNERCKRLPKIKLISKSRKDKIKARSKGNLLVAIEDWNSYFEAVSKSSFLCGDNDRNWRADFDWLIKSEDPVIKIYEGKYR